jgi:putative ABC transport system ATP-binding protein
MSEQFIYNIERLSFHYQLGANKIMALNNIVLKIKKGEFACICGPSGSGKSTLLNLLGLIEHPQEGHIYFKDRDVAFLREVEKNEVRRKSLGFVFQSFHLLEVLNAYENVDYFLVRQGLSKSERKIRVNKALSSVGLWEHRFKRPLEMSGGQKQRVAVARALAKNPEVIIADEPTASLDQETGKEIMKILKSLNEEFGTTIILSSHDPMVIENSPYHIKLQDGKIVKEWS